MVERRVRGIACPDIMPRERYDGWVTAAAGSSASCRHEWTTQICDPRTTHQHNMAQSDEEDDYMNMVFDDAPKGPKYETSLQRAARKRKEVRLVALPNCATLTR